MSVAANNVAVWQSLRDGVEALHRFVGLIRSVHVNDQVTRAQAEKVSQFYLRSVRPVLLNDGVDAETIATLDEAFQGLLRLSAARNVTASYKKRLKIIRRLIPRVTTALELHAGENTTGLAFSPSDNLIAETLDRIVPSAALSYRQALADLADVNRTSFRGPGLELREALREVLDHLAPDQEVANAPGFKLEKDRTKPTQRQKALHILKARGRSRTAMDSPSEALATVDGLAANLARSVYNHGSLAAHVQSSRDEVTRLKRYVDVILLDILEL